jgi:hypothetical protein
MGAKRALTGNGNSSEAPQSLQVRGRDLRFPVPAEREARPASCAPPVLISRSSSKCQIDAPAGRSPAVPWPGRLARSASAADSAPRSQFSIRQAPQLAAGLAGREGGGGRAGTAETPIYATTGRGRVPASTYPTGILLTMV